MTLPNTIQSKDGPRAEILQRLAYTKELPLLESYNRSIVAIKENGKGKSKRALVLRFPFMSL